MMADVFSSLPQDVDTLSSFDDLQEVRKLLEANKGVWLTTDRIAALLGWPASRTAEKVRKVKGELLLLGVPIVESHAGYKIAEHVSEIDKCLDKEHVRLKGLHRTIQALEECRMRMAQGQKVVEVFR